MGCRNSKQQNNQSTEHGQFLVDIPAGVDKISTVSIVKAEDPGQEMKELRRKNDEVLVTKYISLKFDEPHLSLKEHKKDTKDRNPKGDSGSEDFEDSDE
jgi:hypothetical protein